MRLLQALALAVGLIGAASAVAADRPAAMLTQADLDAAMVLPPPPAAGSPQAQAELAELHGVEARRTPAEAAAARAEGEIKDASIFDEAVGPGVDLTRLPATTRLMAIVRETEKAVVARGKDEFRRPRPWIVDPAIGTCKRSEGEPLSSYPSGHAASAYAYAATLARLVPDRAGPILARAARYAETRITCEQHFRSDVTAGQTLGLLVSDRLRGMPAFMKAFDEARSELRAGGLTR